MYRGDQRPDRYSPICKNGGIRLYNNAVAGCCKATTIYGFGRSADYPGNPTADQLSRQLYQELNEIWVNGYYGVITVFLIESQVKVTEPVLRKFGFRKVLNGKGSDTAVRVWLYALSADKLETVLEKNNPLKKRAAKKAVPSNRKVLE